MSFFGTISVLKITLRFLDSKMMGDNFVLDLCGLLALLNYISISFSFRKKGENQKRQDNKNKREIADINKIGQETYK